MMTSPNHLASLSDLRSYVNRTLCEHHELEVGVFRMNERILLRGGNPCGIFFCLYGPGALVFTAIWETDSNAILFYGPSDQRFRKTQLKAAPRLEAVAA